VIFQVIVFKVRDARKTYEYIHKKSVSPGEEICYLGFGSQAIGGKNLVFYPSRWPGLSYYAPLGLIKVVFNFFYEIQPHP
jgi:hypothetical protein